MAFSLKMLVLALVLLAPSPALAEWKEARSTNFIVYSEGKEAQLREFAEKLEKFNFILRTFHKVSAPPNPNPLKVYLFPNIDAVGKVAGSDRIAGYYVRRARGPFMVGTRASASTSRIDAESILLHEYTHHFMYQYFPATYPTWYSEGFAEFWGSIDILPKDVVEVGLPAEFRFGSFFANRWLPVRKMLTAQSYADVPEVDLLYAQGWLLVRYAFENAERKRQLDAYLHAINGGASYEEAMKRAFQDVDRLNSELFDYARKTKFSVVRLPFKPIATGPIAVRALSPAEDALLTLRIALDQGIGKREAADFAGKVRREASRFPGDPDALFLLAEAERLAGNSEAARTAVDRLLAVQPDHARGLMLKGQLALAALRTAGSKDQKAWTAARQIVADAHRKAPKDPLILEAFYDSYRAQGVLPPGSAQAALYEAMELAPSDPDLRYKVAADFERRGMIAEAIAIIRPSAYAIPHRKEESAKEKREREEREEKNRAAGEERRETAREMLDRLEKKAAAENKAA